MKRGAATRARILEAAEQLFAEHGFQAATTAAIARRAGVAEGSIYRHFESKQDLLVQLAAERFAAPVSNLLGDFSHLDDESLLRTLIRERFRTARRYAPLAKVFLLEAQHQEELRERYIGDVATRIAAMGEAIVQSRIDAGEWRPVNPKIALGALIGMAVTFVAWSAILGGDKYVKFDPDEVVDGIVDIFLHGVKKQA